MKRQHVPTFEVFLVSVDFDTKIKTRSNPPYGPLANLLRGLGGVLAPTHQMRLLVSPYRAVKIRDTIKASLLRGKDRVYVGKIAPGHPPGTTCFVSQTPNSKKILRTWAKGVEPTRRGNRSSASRDI